MTTLASTQPAAPPAALPILPILHGVRVLSLALNLPGPAALMRCQQMGAACTKLEPLGAGGGSGDPMAAYCPDAYVAMHAGITQVSANLKTPEGQATLHTLLAATDVLITSFRPSALPKLGLDWPVLQEKYPALSMVAIVGAPGARADEPGHDLTYLAESGLVTGLDLPATLYADMGGSLMTTEAVLQAVLHQRATGHGLHRQVALSDAAAYMGLPRQWGLTQPHGSVGGAHAGYRVYPCQDGRVALAALEPHFAQRLCEAAGISLSAPDDMLQPSTHAAVADFLRTRNRATLDALAHEKDIPLHCMN